MRGFAPRARVLFLSIGLTCMLAGTASIIADVARASQKTAGTADPVAARTAPLDQAIPVSPRVTVGRLSNGLRYYIRQNQEPENRAELRLAVNVGSILEDDDQRGLAHFIEHMAFNGTENFEKQKLVAFMESIGMRLGPGVNASTSFDETVYMLRLPTDQPEHMATAFQILEDWAHGLTLDGEEIELERRVVIEEWRLDQGAASRIRDQQFPVLFQGSQYAKRLPIGTLENLQTFEHDVLRRFYRDWYRPELMAVIAVGDFDTSMIEKLVQQHFKNLPASVNPRDRKAYKVPDHDGTLFSIATDPELPVTSVAVYYKLPGDDDWTIGGYRQRLVESLYNGILNRRFSEIARQPDSPFLRASSGKGRLIRPTYVYALNALVPEGGIERGLNALLTEAERVARFGFTKTELDRQKTNLLTGIERSYINRENRNSNAFASEYVRAFLTGEPIPGIEYEYALHRRFVPEIRLEEVNAIGRNWIDEDNRIVLITGPEKEDLAMPSKDALITVLDAVPEAEISAYVDTVSNEPLLAKQPEGLPVVTIRTREGELTEWELANGITVVLKPTDFREDQIVFRGFSPGGTSLASDEDYIPANTAATLITNSGVGEFNAIDLQKALTGKVANVTPFISTYEEGVQGNASPRDLETMFQLIYLRFTAPRADESFYQVFTTQTRSALKNRNANPTTVFGDTYTRLITQDHVRLRPPTVSMLDEMDLSDSFAFYTDRFADASDYTFVFVGNLDLRTMRPLVERYLGGLPTTGRQETWHDIGVRPPSGVIEETVRRGLAPRSQTLIGFTGPFDFDSQTERTLIAALVQTLQTQLRDVMREELGGTYSVSLNASPAWRPEEAYTLTISYGSDPERTEEMLKTVFKEIERFKTTGPSQNDVRDTRQALLRSHETRLEQNNFWLGQLAAIYARGQTGADNILSYPASVEALTPDSIREAARMYLNTDNYVRVTLMPEQ